jgi:hypothetical protein
MRFLCFTVSLQAYWQNANNCGRAQPCTTLNAAEIFLIEFHVTDLDRLCCTKRITTNFSFLTFYTFLPLLICEHYSLWMLTYKWIFLYVWVVKYCERTRPHKASLPCFCLVLVLYYTESLSAWFSQRLWENLKDLYETVSSTRTQFSVIVWYSCIFRIPQRDNMWMCLQLTFVSLFKIIIITPSPDRHGSRVT